jgi:hypothetical protein
MLFGGPVAVLLGAAAIAWAGVTLKTWNDGDTLTAADLNANFAALNAALPKSSVYSVWGRTTCGGSDVVLHTGYLTGWGGGQGAMGGGPMCLDDTLAASSWLATGWATASRAVSVGNTASHRSEVLVFGSITCAVCKGSSYVLWGRTTCGAGDSAVYQGHIGGLSYNSSFGAQYTSGPVCIDDGASGVGWNDWTWNGTLWRAAGANGSTTGQYLDAADAPCVVCR